MGKTARKLYYLDLPDKTIFNNRFVIEICERVHIHYRNLRLNLNLPDFVQVAEGFSQALKRWNKRDSPQPEEGKHIELCRKRVAMDSINEGMQINLNHNLYLHNRGRIYAEGAEFDEDKYIHLKIRDIRLELSLKEFRELAYGIKEAEKRLQDSDINAKLQKA